MAVELIRFCDRCRCTVPLDEWRFHPNPDHWVHEGEQRGVIEWDELDDDRQCGFVLPVRGRV